MICPKQRSLSVFLIALVLTLVSSPFSSADAQTQPQDEVLINGDLSKGAGAQPDHWQSEGWQSGSDFTSYSWRRAGATPGELEVDNLKPNDARWSQKMHLGAGWYHFTAEMRCENVPEGRTGANLSVLEDGIISEQLHGTTGWTPLGFYLKVGEGGADIALACRMGGYAGENTGKAWCRNLKGVKSGPPPAETAQKYDLDVIRNVSATPPTSSSGGGNTAQVTIFFLAAILVLVGLFASRGERGKRIFERIFRARAESGETPRAAPPPPDPARRQTEIALFLVCMLTFAYFYQASDHSTASRIDLIRSILERHSLWIDGYAGYNTADIVQLNSRIYSNKAPGGAITGIVPWIISTGIVGLFSQPPSGFYWAFATHLTTVLSVSLIVALMAVLMYRFALLLGAGTARAVALALILPFGTIMFPHATEFTSEPIAAFCEFLAFYLLALPQDDETWWRPLIPGLLAGWGVFCDYPTFLLAVSVAGYAAWRLASWRKIVTFAAGAVIVADLLMLYDKYAFGNPFFLSYEAYMLPGSDRFAAQARGFAGVTYPHLSILWDVLLGAQRGLFFCNPVTLLTIPGLYFFWRRKELRPEFLTVAIAIVSMTLLNASYGDSIVYWGGGTATGPRHFLPVMPFVVLAMAFLPDLLNPLLGALGLISAFMMIMATAIEPHLPYEYEHPFGDFLWPAYLRGDLAYNKSTYFAGGPIAGDSVAFNLGKLVGLPGWLQLWPLAALWIGAAIYLLRTPEPGSNPGHSRRSGLIVPAGIAVAVLFAPPTLGRLFQPRLDQAQGLLGCYYEGLRPNGEFPPHIKRIDAQIDFDNIVQLGALPSPSAVIWRGKLNAPTAGHYLFMILVDDLGWLKIDGRTVIADPGDVEKARSSGEIDLAAGPHTIEVGERNIWGDASMHLQWQPPGGTLQPVPSGALTPDQSDCRPG
jgi:hypothetical protein